MYKKVTPGWELGKWLVICDRCGFKRTNDQVRREWTGLMVCADTCWEPRHPQEFVRPRADQQSVPFTRPEPAESNTAITINCDTATVIDYPREFFASDFTVVKGRVQGPVTITGNVTIICSLEVLE